MSKLTIHLLAPEDKNKWPDVWHHCFSIFQKLPYKIKMWGDNDIDEILSKDDKEFLDILNTLPPIYKLDYVRYLILEKTLIKNWMIQCGNLFQ